VSRRCGGPLNTAWRRGEGIGAVAGLVYGGGYHWWRRGQLLAKQMGKQSESGENESEKAAKTAKAEENDEASGRRAAASEAAKMLQWQWRRGENISGNVISA
jgi:hypothetical protein